MSARSLILTILLLVPLILPAQDDVFITEEDDLPYYGFFVPINVVANRNESPLKGGAGFGFMYASNPLPNKAVYMGGEFSYVFMGSDKITYNEDEYLSSSASFWNLNLLLQYRIFRHNKFGVYPEISAGLLMPGFSSTYNVYDYQQDDYVGSLEKIRLFLTPNSGIGLGVRLFEYVDVKFRYSVSMPVKHFHPSDVYEVGSKIFYPYVKKPINRFEINLAVMVN
ncbi:hypothetical protein ACE1ET_16090 [Saccharicrinis sp. FJH62]|uniref:hypothetical protein n=1 Tax=Saccharicrinis sp. FJH62 TaxID=3344657 RepID=UPI0035D504E2